MNHARVQKLFPRREPETGARLFALLGALLVSSLLGAQDQQPGTGPVDAVVVTADGRSRVSFARAGGDADVLEAASVLRARQGARIIVKLREQEAQQLAGALPKEGDGKIVADAVAVAPVADFLRRHGARKAEPLSRAHVEGRWRQGRSAKQATAELARRFPRRAARRPTSEAAPGLPCTFVLELDDPSPQAVTAAIEALRKTPGVVYAEPDKVMRALYVPNDPSYAKVGSWGQSYADLYGLKAIDTTQAWDLSQGTGVVVAVVDTGIDYNHPDIAANIWKNPREIAGNGIDDDGNGFIDDVRGWDFVGASMHSPVADNDPIDVSGHGTHVAGTIAAVGDNNLGVVGVAWQAKVMAVRGLDNTGYGNDSDLARAIIYAADNGADVINMSFGGDEDPETIAEAVRYAHGLGVVLVAAAGNDSSDAVNYTPANVPEAITVSALNPTGTRAYFSNYGSKVDLAAPGMDILSLKVRTTDYTRMDGTSMAAPHVSGVAALVLSRHPAYTNEQVRQAMRAAADDLAPAGRDSDYGYGRVNAAQAVSVDQVLAAKILAPRVGVEISEPVSITGVVGGADLDHYVVDYGSGSAPVQWTVLSSGTASVTHGEIGRFDPAGLPEGTCVVRLRAYARSGRVFSDQVEFKVLFLEFTNPSPPPVPSITTVLKPGVTLALAGSARGRAFQSYRLEWAPGVAAESGWSAAGVTLSQGGLVAVERGSLGSWALPADAQGYYTIRMTVIDGSLARTMTTSVYVEPALLSEAWPRYVASLQTGNNPVPVRQPDGSSRVVVTGITRSNGGTSDPSKVRLYSVDGTVVTRDLTRGSAVQPAVGDLDGLPGEEIVVPDGYRLRVFASDLTPLRTITESVLVDFSMERVFLADLDGDGLKEIFAVACDFENDVPRKTLRIYRGDGSALAGWVPVKFPGSSSGRLRALVADLDGDEHKEIITTTIDSASERYKVEAFRADGAPFERWATYVREGYQCEDLVAADLDGEGTTELIVSEYDSTAGRGQIRVLDHTGLERSGWPVTCGANVWKGYLHVSVGDLDRDGRIEVLAATPSQLYVFRADGSWWNEPQPVGDGTAFNSNTAPLVADVDGDGVPELIIGSGSLVVAEYYKVASVGIYTNHGLLKRNWPLFGMEGQQPERGVPALADFSGAGRADLLVGIPTIFGKLWGGYLVDSTVTILATGGTWSPAAGDWIMPQCDAQGSFTIPQRAKAPVIVGQPENQIAAVGASAAFTVVAHGYPRPTFRWLKDGVALAGATSSTYTIANVAARDAGSYSVAVHNRLGEAASVPATLRIGYGYAAWALSHGLGAASGSDDPDGDGLANLAEFALVRDPLVSDSSAVTALQEVAGQMVFSFRRPRAVVGVTYTVQISTDLQNWETAPGTPEVADAGTGVETVTVAFAPASARGFARLLLTVP